MFKMITIRVTSIQNLETNVKKHLTNIVKKELALSNPKVAENCSHYNL
jgi:hypothetical protein